MKKNGLVISLDIDDVTLDLFPHWLSKYNEVARDNVKMSQIKSWDAGAYVKNPDLFYNFLKDKKLYNGILPVAGAINGINKLKNKGYRIIFVTASTLEHSGIKFNILKSLKLVDNYSDYIEASDKSLIRADILVDDKVDNCVNFKGNALLFSKPWNKTFKIPRADNWKEVLEQVNYYERYGHFYL